MMLWIKDKWYGGRVVIGVVHNWQAGIRSRGQSKLRCKVLWL